MAGGGKKAKAGGSKKGQPNWTPYLIAAGVALLALVVYSAVYSAPSTPSASGGARAPQSMRPPLAQLEGQMRSLATGLSGVAGRGDTGIFKKIKAMADKAQDVLARADATESDEEKRTILEEGLASKAEMLEALTGHADKLHAEDAKEQKEHAPLSLDPNGNVMKLTKESFTTFVAKNPRSMVEFYAPWCGHCKKLAPEYEMCAQKFKGRAGFAAVDATEETQLSRVFEVGGYPTLKWFVNGKPMDYTGPRTAKHISDWVEERLTPAYNDIEPTDDLGSAVEAAPSATGICSGSGSKSSATFKAFEMASEHFRGKLLFVWAPEPENEALRLFRTGRGAETCRKAGEEIMGGHCKTSEEVIAWLDDALTFDDEDGN